MKKLSGKQKFYLKSFLWTGLPFSLVMVLVDILSGDAFNLWEFLFYLIFFGAFMTFFMGKAQVSAVKKIQGDTIKAQDLRTKQVKKVSSFLSPEEILDLLHSTFHYIKAKLDKEEDEEVIKIKCRPGSEGMLLEVKISWLKNEDGCFSYTVQSKPLFFTILYDSGVNLKNVNQIVKLIEKNA